MAWQTAWLAQSIITFFELGYTKRFRLAAFKDYCISRGH